MASDRPKLFIASSAEGLAVAGAIKESLAPDVDCCLWNEPGIFGVSEIAVNSLAKALELFPYGVVVLTPDDMTTSRGRRRPTPRDNLIFEVGMFAGRHGLGSVFMAVPAGHDVKLPSDLAGVLTARYRVTMEAGSPRYDVTAAASGILAALRKAERSKPQPGEELAFWDTLSRLVVIVFGVEESAGGGEPSHPRVSLRDLEAAHAITSFLSRRDPDQRVITLPALATGWQGWIPPEADLVLIGGFVSNVEFARLQSRFRRGLRLKMGRLCRIEGQKVHHVAFGRLPPGVDPPPRARPDLVDRFPSEHVVKDFGFVFSAREEIYGARRQVIAIAGIKGNGTRGATQCLLRPSTHTGLLNSVLGNGLDAEEALEMVIEVDVVHDVVDRVQVVEVLRDGRSVLGRSAGGWVDCELGRPCEGCGFGEADAGEPARGGGLGRVEAIVFDLDDTLIDTFHRLIVPLEEAAARAMVEKRPGLGPEGDLAALLLELRRAAPASLEAELVRRRPDVDEEALAARRKLLDRVSLESLAPDPDLRRLLESLGTNHRLYLLTSGDPSLQSRKIDRAGFRRLFDEVVILDSAPPGGLSPADGQRKKEEALRALLDSKGHEGRHVLVVGNRLDDEIRAGKRLGLRTVWVRRGEGADLVPGADEVAPDFVVGQVGEIYGLLTPAPD